MPSVLIVDDLVSIHEMLEAVIAPTGFATAFATDGEKALARCKNDKFDLVLADIDMKPMDGITLLRQLKAADPNAVVIIMTAYASTESAVQALKFGAFDYLQKPFRVDELLATLKRALEYKNFQAAQTVAAASGAQAADIDSRLIGQSPKFTKLITQVRKLATVRTPVLLVGENGTGKSTIAELLHASTGAPDSALLRIDCALSTESSFRDGLLGQNGEGGAWVRQAKGGTLFLQRLECLNEGVQKELVSVLRNTAHGFRLICTAGCDLEQLVDEGKFHDELFYRVASLPVQVPSLRERTEDIGLLAKHFAAQATNPAFDCSLIEFTEDALDVLGSYGWPGNLTELAQVISKVAAGAETRVVTSQQLPLRLRDVKQWPTLGEFLAGQEKQYVDQVIHACRGDTTLAAKILGVELVKVA